MPTYRYRSARPCAGFALGALATLLVTASVAVLAPAAPKASAETAPAGHEWGCIQEFNGQGEQIERCGFGYWRTLCGWNAGVEECETFFELIDGAMEPGVSSVLFLPGIKGSRLYRPEPGCDGSPEACAVKLWEPYGSAFARQLFLDEDGRGMHDDVYARAGDVLSTALGQRFYASFITDLNDLMISGRFGAGWRWEAGAYDWRLSLSDIITRGEREDDRVFFGRTGEAPYLEAQLRSLAVNSPTGKVTIVAHSNGGLVAKALIEKLGSEAATLVDTVIFVGVPHFGAPQALGALLFGHGEALPFDGCATARIVSELCSLLMDRPTARSFAEHAPMAYHLLPSRGYFEALRASAYDADEAWVATFSGDSHHLAEQEAYGGSLDTEAELHAFASAQDGGRTKPADADTARANVLSSSLLAYARDIHEALDRWRAPPGIKTQYVIGWGKETISGIEFYEEPSILGFVGASVPRYRPLFQFEGDGVVPALSASAEADIPGDDTPEPIPVSLGHTPSGTFSEPDERRYWVDLDAINADRIGSGFGHGTLFEADAVRHLLSSLIGAASGAEIAVPQHVLAAEPGAPTEKSWLRIFLHSPLTLELYAGDKHLGIAEDGTFDDEIPGARYGEFGEVKYITAPSGEPYTVVLRGYGTGRFSLDIQEVRGARATTTTITQVPVTPGLTARVELPAHDPSVTALALDHDGDGTPEDTIAFVPGATTPYTGTDTTLDQPNEPLTMNKASGARPSREVRNEKQDAYQSMMSRQVEVDNASTNPEPVTVVTAEPTEHAPTFDHAPAEPAAAEGVTMIAEHESGEPRMQEKGSSKGRRLVLFALPFGLGVIGLLLFLWRTVWK